MEWGSVSINIKMKHVFKQVVGFGVSITCREINTRTVTRNCYLYLSFDIIIIEG